MRIDDITLTVRKLIRADTFFENISVINAFPNRMKSTRLSRPVIAVGVDTIEMESEQIESSSRSGAVSVFADIFLPTDSDISRLENIFSNLCRCFNRFNILSIRTSRVKFDDYAQAYVMKTVFTFNDEIEFGSGDE